MTGKPAGAEPAVPASITWQQLADALRSLGIDPDRLERFEYRRRRLVVEHYRVDEAGRIMAAGNEVSLVTRTIGIER